MRSARHLLLVAVSGLALTTGAFAAPALAQTAAPAAATAVQVAPSAPWAQAASDIPADPAVRYGLLPNGMRYALLHNATPPGQASFRLRIDAGSLMERDDQKGLAHFMEHMAFNGTKEVPENEMLRILERLGLAFGADTNAFTSFDQTAYMLELPNTKDETVDPSLHILREMMSAALMAPDAIDAERGVIVGEERTRDTPQLRVLKTQLGLLAPGQRLSERLPIGDLDIIRNAPRQRFVDFYDAYYRPSRATFIAVGDFDVDAMEAKVRAAFADWKPTAADGPEPDLGTVAAREPQTSILVEPGIQSSIQLNWIKNPDLDPDTVAERAADIRRGLGLAVLNRRLGEIARADNPPFIGAGAGYQSLFDSLDAGTLSVAFNPGGWQRALETVEQESRRLAEYGVTDAELQREIVNTRTALQNAVASAATRSTPALATGLLGAVNDDQVFSAPQTNLDLFNAAVEGLTADQVNQATKAVFEGQGPLVLFSSPVPVEGGEAAVTAALEASRNTPIQARAVEAELKWPYDNFGAPAVPASRTEVADLGATLVRFPNGTLLNIKKTDFRAEQILVSARTGIGELGLPADTLSPLSMASTVLTPGGLGKLSLDEINRVLSGRTYSASVNQAGDAYVFSGATKPADLQLELQVLAAYLTDPGLRAAPFEQTKAMFPQILAQLGATPRGVFQRDASGLLAGGDAREVTPTAEQVAAIQIDDVRNGVRSALAQGPVEITVVGDVDIDPVIAAVGSTFGALPSRGAEPTPPAGSTERKFPAPTATPVQLYHTGPAEQALGFVAWPTTDQIADRKTARQLSILSDVLQLRLNDEIREKQGLAYSPSAGSSASDVYPGYGFISVTAETPPAALPKLFETVDAIAADLRDKPVSDDELNRARRPAVERLRRSMADNGYWMTQLAEAQSNPATLDQTRSQVATLEAVTAADLQTLARQYLKPDAAWRATVTAQAAADQTAPAQ
ncbi:insulinase family protein [Brevundimonas intermedia]|uniref:Insulinase family protein n=1 Tax=Brevundimonas intermedia TaxID=74315 RepID=A0A4Y9S5P1_9CAUL|nr:M16 family metallopeptidase [Brevundimonas intermedia]TFW15319.1 insulinase family protein [Brevundimonas intermedia]